MRVLVTGHEGFVGQHLVDRLIKLGHEVAGADIRSRDNIQGMTGTDLSNEDIARAVIKNVAPDIVMHLASRVSTTGSLRDPADTFKHTVRVGVNVIDACRVTDTPIIITSSVKAREPATTPYGVSKRCVEMWAQDAQGLRYVINRPGTIYGPGQEGSAESGWIAWFLKAKRESLPVTINRPGTQIRDLLHVHDYVRLLVQQMSYFRDYEGKLWDVGGGWENAVTVLEMADYLDLDWKFGPERYGDDLEYVGYNATPNWKPKIRWKDAEVFQ